MNILQVLPTLDVGGVETGTVDLARHLVKNGHRAIVISGGGRLVKQLETANVRHHILPVGKKSLVNGIKMIWAIADIIRREDVDIVHARSRIPAWSAYFASKLTGRKFITTAHGYYARHLLSMSMAWGRYVIVASNIMAKHMVQSFAVPHDRIRLVPRGVDLAQFTFRDPATHFSKEFTIGMVARITPLKGHADFIKAVAMIVRQIPQCKVIIAGGASKDRYRQDLDLLVRRLGLTRTLEFVGPSDDIPKIMAKLDVLVSATITPEAFGRVIVEAQASGVPVVATRVGGVVDIIEDEKTGLFCQPNDPRDLAAKVMRLYKEKTLWEGLARMGRKNAEERYNLPLMMTRTLAVYKETIGSMNILIIKMSAMGDVILSVPSLRAIRGYFPQAKISVLVDVGCREVLDRSPYIDELIVCDLKDRDKGIRGFLRLGDELRKKSFDIVIDLQNNKKSHLLAFISLAPLRYGYDNGKLSMLLNKRIKDDAPFLDPIEHQFRVLRAAGIRAQDKHLELWPSEASESEIERFIKEQWLTSAQDLVGINIKASDRWMTKNWPPSYIAQLCDRLAKEGGVRVVLTGTKADAAYANQIAQLAHSKPIVAAGKTSMAELVSLMKRFRAYVTPDSAPLHVAASVGTPFIALFGPTDPARHLPPAENCIVISKSKELRCGPCYSPRCMKNYRCMKKIGVDEVFDALKPFIQRRCA